MSPRTNAAFFSSSALISSATVSSATAGYTENHQHRADLNLLVLFEVGAVELAQPITDILAQVRSIVATAEPFDPAKSRRRFTIGAPDGVSAVVLPPLLSPIC
jgi:hypothetical protein